MTAPVATRVALADACDDWEQAVARAVGMLVDLGVATDDYVRACVESLHVNGPYIVLAQGLALAHARPEQGATGLGVTLLKVGEPVVFGHPVNDPVDLVFAFSTPDPDGHLAMLQVLAKALAGGLADQLRTAQGVPELTDLLNQATSHE